MSTDPKFIHLRLHSEFSITDSTVRINEAVSRAAEDQMPALALTDLSNLFGLVKFYQSACRQGVKPIIGCDVWITNETNRDKPSRLLLLCQSYSGYLFLCELLSRAYRINQHRGKAEIKQVWFQENIEASKGLIVLSGAHYGAIGQSLQRNNLQFAESITQEWATLFPGSFYLEVQRDGYQREEILLHRTLTLASKLSLPVVATQSIQYLSADDYTAHEARVCIAEGHILGDSRRPKNFTTQQYFKTQAEMAEIFNDVPAALINSIEIAKRCNFEVELGINRLPQFPTPNNASLEIYLSDQAHDGLKRRMKQCFPDSEEYDKKLTAYQERLQFEVEIIIQMGFPGYFLIVADFINWAKENNVPVGPGRGSGAGSLVAYSLGITDLDPIRYDLLFERFLNPERISMPDFDIDFCQDRRELVIEYVKERYSTESVSQIVTFGTMAAKAVVRDVGRVLDLPYNFIDQLAKLIPFELGMTLQKARATEPQLNQRAEEEEDVKNLLALAEKLEGLTRNVGMHAGGVLIAPGKITDFCPIYCSESGDSIVSQLDKDDVEKIGLVKFDFLGLRTLTILDRAIAYIHQQPKKESQEENTTEPIALHSLPLNDQTTYSLLRQGNAIGVFQFESRGMKDLLKKARPDRFEDIVALVALYRPGPMDLIPDFIARKHGKQIDYLDPRLEPILSPTYGIMIYQEQVMQIAQVIGGYSLGNADLLRRAMGKKKVEEMAQQRDIFVAGAVKNGLDENKATELFGLMEKFAGYGFNKSHAAAYALISFQTAYLKTHYPAEFMSASLSSDMDDTDKVHIFIEDCQTNNLTILPPDINQSDYYFVPVDQSTIRYGLGAIKGTGEAAISSIVQERNKNGVFHSLFDFCCRVDRRVTNRRAMEALIRVGSFDTIYPDRARLFASIGKMIESAEQISRSANQESLFDESDEAIIQPPLVDAKPWTDREVLQQEKSGLGFYFSGHPFKTFQREIKDFIKIRLNQLDAQKSGQLIAGIISSVRIQMTRRGRMCIISLDDNQTKIELVVFDELFDQNRAWLKEDTLLVAAVKTTRYRRDDDEESSDTLRITAEELYSLANARSHYAKQIIISCDAASLSPLSQLQTLLTTYIQANSINGSNEAKQADASQMGNQLRHYCPVSITYHNQQAICTLELSSKWRVNLHDDLLRHLEGHFQAKNIKIIY